MIYLDYMSSTPLDPHVREVMFKVLEGAAGCANPGAQHAYGRQAKQSIMEATQQVADAIHASGSEIIWTSGATEANNLALFGLSDAYQAQGRHVITVATEHKAVLEPCEVLAKRGYRVSFLTPNSDGLLPLEAIAETITPETILLSVMHVNNEIGVIQNIPAISELCARHGVLVHVDAAQSMGKLPLNIAELGADCVSLSAHKVYGPQGVGALVLRSQPKRQLTPQLFGGRQQNGLRAGTLATHQIVGMGAAFAIAQEKLTTELAHVRQCQEVFLETLADLPETRLNGHTRQRVPHNVNISFAGITADALLTGLPELAVSTAATCTMEQQQGSHVLSALQVPAKYRACTLRFSFGRFSQLAEVSTAAHKIRDEVNRLRTLSTLI